MNLARIKNCLMVRHHQSRLENTVRVRTGELAHEKDKLELESKKRKHVETGLRDARTINDIILGEAPFGILVYNREGQCLSANKAIASIVGATREELLAQNFRKIESWKSSGLINDAEVVLATGESRKKDALVTTTFGKTVWLEYRFDRFMSGGKPHLLLMAIDISKRKRAESSLKESEARFRELIEDTVDWIWEVNRDGVYTYSSPRVTDLLGYHPDEIVGKTPFDFMPAREAESIRAIYQEMVARQEAFSGLENTNIHKSGDMVVLETSGRPIFDDNGALRGFRGIDRDITERKNSEETLRQREKQLRQAQKMEAIGTLAGGIAHDFNNILYAIIGYAEMARDDRRIHEDLKKCIDEVLVAADRAKSLVRRILTFSRKGEQERQALQVSLVVKEALKLLRSSLPTTIDIKQDIASEANVLADPTRIHQVVMNLGANAYHAMRETGGKLGVALKEVDHVASMDAPGLELAPGRYIRLEISDTGTGMDEETRAKIFDPYFTTKAPGEGTGLGLAVVHGIVEGVGGRIHIYSEVGKGTTVHVYLPVCEGEIEASSPGEASPPLTGGNETIMLVDDEAKIVDVAKRNLARSGYEVCWFTNGVQAWQEFQQSPGKYDLVVTDMTMPYMTGAELAMKVLELRPDLPVIICTGHSALINREKALAMGIKAYCEKPLNMKRLLNIVRNVLDDARR